MMHFSEAYRALNKIVTDRACNVKNNDFKETSAHCTLKSKQNVVPAKKWKSSSTSNAIPV